MQVLCIDVGNTTVKIALVNSTKVSNKYTCSQAELLPKLQLLFSSKKIEHSIVSSVAGLPKNVIAFLQKKSNCQIVSTQMQLPFTMLYKTTQTLGVDRIALLAQAATQFPFQNTLIVAAGTCITYNFINAKQQFAGGAISPGLQMRLQAMHQYTKKLPMVAINTKVKMMATTTETSLQSGAWHGLVAEVQGICTQYAQIHPKINLVLTGGGGTPLAATFKSRIFADANFLLKGLYAIYCNNYSN